MSGEIKVHTGLEGFPSLIIIRGDGHGIIGMSFPEANKLQEDIRRALVIEGVTLRDAT